MDPRPGPRSLASLLLNLEEMAGVSRAAPCRLGSCRSFRPQVIQVHTLPLSVPLLWHCSGGPTSVLWRPSCNHTAGAPSKHQHRWPSLAQLQPQRGSASCGVKMSTSGPASNGWAWGLTREFDIQGRAES